MISSVLNAKFVYKLPQRLYLDQTHLHHLSEYVGMICTTVSTRAHSASGKSNC